MKASTGSQRTSQNKYIGKDNGKINNSSVAVLLVLPLFFSGYDSQSRNYLNEQTSASLFFGLNPTPALVNDILISPPLNFLQATKRTKYEKPHHPPIKLYQLAIA